MKNLIYIFILFLFASQTDTFAQTPTAIKNTAVFVKRAQVTGNSYAGRTLQNCISKALDDDYLISSNALIWIEPSATVGDEKIIEGMDTYSYVDLELGFVLKNTMLQEQVVWTTNVKGKGSNKSSAITDGLKNICRDKKNKTDIRAFVENYLEKMGTTNCNQILTAIQQFKAENKFNQALLALDYIHADSPCASSKKQLEGELLAAHKKYTCEQVIQKTSVMAHSGIAQQMRQAVSLLVTIPPDAPCASEAIELAKVIGEKSEKLGTKTQAQLDRQIIILNENKQSEWRREYRRHLYYRK